MIVAVDARRLGLGDEPRDQRVAADAPLAVEGIGPVVVVVRRDVADADAVDEDAADRRPIRQLAADAHHAEVVAGRARRQLLGLHVQQPDVPEAHLPRDAAAAEDRNLLAVVVDADAAAEEQVDFARVAHREEAGVLQEERPLLGEEQVEAIEVHLLVVDLHLREVGVVGAVERQAGRDVVLGVDAHLAEVHAV